MNGIPTKEAVLAAERVLGFLVANPTMWNQHMWVVTPGLARNINEQVENGQDLSYLTYLDPSVSTKDSAIVLESSCGSSGCFCGWLAGDQGLPLYFPRGEAASATVAAGPDEGTLLERWGTDFLALPGDSSVFGMFAESNNIHMLAQWVRALRHAHTHKITVLNAFTALFGEDAERYGPAEPSILFSDDITEGERVQVQIGALTEDELS